MTHDCSSTIAGVVVHARGALVRRRVELPASAGATDGDLELLVPGLTALAEPGSVRAELAAPSRRVARVGCQLVVPSERAAVGPSVERVRAIAAEIARLEAERDRLQDRVASLSSLAPRPRVGFFSATPIDARVEQSIETGALVAELHAAADARRRTVEDRLEDLARQRERARLADHQSSSAERAGRGHPTRAIRLLLDGSGPVTKLEVSYLVPAARWWPTYTLRVSDGGTRAVWTIEALVAQLSGEDWRGVALALSTADLVSDARLPELPSLRWGRAQPRPRPGYRPPPAGLERMFAGFDAAFPSPPPEPPARDLDEDFGEVSESPADLARPRPRPKAGKKGQSRGAPMPPAPSLRAPMAPPAPVSASVAPPAPPLGGAPAPGSGERYKSLAADDTTLERLRSEPDEGAADRFGESETPTPPPTAIEPSDAWLDFDALTLAPASDPVQRGRLARDPSRAGERFRDRAAATIEGLSPSLPVRDPRDSRGNFDHRYDADGAAEVPSDGRLHRITVAAAATVPRLAWRTVPREAAEVYREATLDNPFDAPLLAGPVDVYVEGTLLSQTEVERIDRGGLLHVGMGVEERIRVARNARVDEESAGLLGGSTVVDHAVTIDLTSSLAHPARVEVLDRLAISDEKGLEVALGDSKPPPERYDQAERGHPVRGGLRWWIDLPAGAKRTIDLRWRITLPSKNEVIGGNRRE